MVFKRPKFFLDLGGAEGNQPPVVVAPPAAAPAKAPAPAATGTADAAPASAAEAVTAAGPALTTAEAIAAELAAAEAQRPAPTMATFAPECLTPGGAAPMRRRTGGANLGVFKDMAAGMMRQLSAPPLRQQGQAATAAVDVRRIEPPRLTGCQPAASARSSSSAVQPPSGPDRQTQDPAEVAPGASAGEFLQQPSAERQPRAAGGGQQGDALPPAVPARLRPARVAAAAAARAARTARRLPARSPCQRCIGQRSPGAQRLATRGCRRSAPSSVAIRQTRSASRFGTAMASSRGGEAGSWRISGAAGPCSSRSWRSASSTALQSPPQPSTTASRAPGRNRSTRAR